MKILHKVSPHKVSWIKSNKSAFDSAGSLISNLYYPETIDEFQNLLLSLKNKFILIGYSSNTLFLPSFSAEHVICTKELNKWYETETEIICECGVNVSILSRRMVEKGYVGFEGLTDLPGTIAAAVYGNSGCRNCSVNSLVRSFTMLDENNQIKEYFVSDLNLTYRSSALKRGELKGVILQVVLRKTKGNSEVLKEIAERNHQIRKIQQPSAANNLGTTFNGGDIPTLKGKIFLFLERIIRKFSKDKSTRHSFYVLLKMTGNKLYIPYVFCWNRYMFLDEKSHLLFDDYYKFIKSLYKDARLEIEIRK